MNCPEINAILDKLEDDSVPAPVHLHIQEHLDSCRNCQAGMANFLKIGKILERTVYSAGGRDDLLRYLSRLAGRDLHWETPEEAERRKRKASHLRLLIKLAVGFLAAAGVGVSLALILGNLGWIGALGDKKSAIDIPPPPAAETGALPGQAVPSVPAGDDSALEAIVPEGGMNPEAVFEYLNGIPSAAEPGDSGRATGLTPGDSSLLRDLEAELGALRDALSRDPTDTSLRRRMMAKYRQILEERKRLKRKLRVRDYYNLGYFHYSLGEYPQTAIVTGEGLRMVRMGPTQYLHYLKAMSHFQIAMRASEPLPADSTADSAARVRGAQLRAELDREGRRRAVNELRKAITDFSHLLSNPELEESAREWVLRCNEQIGQLLAGQ
ncbi:MAG: hypothetical protein FVQ81_14380 [Candidatus Glassbacteria bacterium]|nr:hypothetical protein [Candidatus Glassbacteria bacterium]